MKETIAVTGAKGMIGSRLVEKLLESGYEVIGIDRSPSSGSEKYDYICCDLGNREGLKAVFDGNKIDRVIHLAALAHTDNEDDLSWRKYYHINVECSKNVFEAANDRPMLFISTVDVFGFFNGGTVNPQTPLDPVTFYGKSKKLAEEECGKLPHYTIFRFSPVYTEQIKRDIQKRYYLRYPKIAYQIGKGTNYEILDIKKAINAMTEWCSQEPQNDVRIIKDDKPMWTPDYIKAEKAAGRAKVVLKLPQWMVNCVYAVAKGITGKNKYTYLLNKAVHPLKSEE